MLIKKHIKSQLNLHENMLFCFKAFKFSTFDMLLYDTRLIIKKCVGPTFLYMLHDDNNEQRLNEYTKTLLGIAHKYIYIYIYI